MIEQVQRLSDVINLIGGGTPKRSKKEFWDGDIPWLSVKDFNHGGRYVEESDETITKLGLEKSSTKLLQPGMLIISARGTVGELAQLKSEMAFNQSCYGIDANTHYLQNDYLYYLLKLKIRELKLIAHGSVFDTITRETFENIEVGIPNKSTQKAIAHILGTLDDKIELNQKMNQTLEDIAKAIFKSWFVDFDPVRAKSEGHPIGLSPKISNLFPDDLEESELGSIPKKWEVKKLHDFLEFDYGRSLPANKRVNGNYNVYGSSGIVGTNNTSNFKGPLIIVGRAGHPGKIHFSNNDCYVIDSAFAVKVHSKNNLYYFLYLLDYLNLSNYQSGSAVPGLNRNTALNVNFCYPTNQNLLDRFNLITKTILDKIYINNNENFILSELRDTLLPKLISGELCIPDAEKFLEEAGI